MTTQNQNYFEYSQNNSGGGWQVDHDAGISEVVFIQASSPAEADSKAEAIGLYFDGLDTGRDCSCCGSRWSPCWQGDEGKEDAPVASKVSLGKTAFVHHSDGRVEMLVGTWDWMGELRKGSTWR